MADCSAAHDTERPCTTGEEGSREEARLRCCYLLRSLSPSARGRTYIGFTVDPQRRLRQHNGEVKGGARKTSRQRPWEMLGFVHGFSDNVSALQFEWAWQHPTVSLAVREHVADLGLRRRSYSAAKLLQVLAVMVRLEEWSSHPLGIHLLRGEWAPRPGAPLGGGPPPPPSSDYDALERRLQREGRAAAGLTRGCPWLLAAGGGRDDDAIWLSSSASAAGSGLEGGFETGESSGGEEAAGRGEEAGGGAGAEASLAPPPPPPPLPTALSAACATSDSEATIADSDSEADSEATIADAPSEDEPEAGADEGSAHGLVLPPLRRLSIDGASPPSHVARSKRLSAPYPMAVSSDEDENAGRNGRPSTPPLGERVRRRASSNGRRVRRAGEVSCLDSDAPS
ncbi:hypothetical protein EMIHUDRAFT_447996 [Emiliania huxleyi CCMP1516]|uniref:GIY-YIG domain-containing protein n=2 Tax=Emiliania huxleyi TaxID=2903 RepID=A0A0D3J429_EMIH1|nr:hypothetical protein EMIHUDRAFT_447996 [Emiliania huxleyi CCMP1516]EOD18264.1 hypothetical protein EMIHUDRAFT_447996 [Emiliania huxleyi CCMP1516]|eukprot:XP_005770693.1 hypothetical protein EMIHUDRAFT_447996 [Emiliania huxleyi CCMP1516]